MTRIYPDSKTGWKRTWKIPQALNSRTNETQGLPTTCIPGPQHLHPNCVKLHPPKTLTSLATTLAPSNIPLSPKGNTWGLPWAPCCIPSFHPHWLKDMLKTRLLPTPPTGTQHHGRCSTCPGGCRVASSRVTTQLLAFWLLGGQTEIKRRVLPVIPSVEAAVSLSPPAANFYKVCKNGATFQLLSHQMWFIANRLTENAWTESLHKLCFLRNWTKYEAKT